MAAHLTAIAQVELHIKPAQNSVEIGDLTAAACQRTLIVAVHIMEAIILAFQNSKRK